MKIFTEILKATPINFIVSYFSFIVQTNHIATFFPAAFCPGFGRSICMIVRAVVKQEKVAEM